MKPEEMAAMNKAIDVRSAANVAKLKAEEPPPEEIDLTPIEQPNIPPSPPVDFDAKHDA